MPKQTTTYLVMGYLHATNRLFQMDLMRRQGEGHLSQVVGQKAISSDEFEDQLGLRRTAEAEWSKMSPADPARQALLDYATGVNDVIANDEKTGQLPVLFKMLGYQPTKWTPVDSLVIQGDMTQTLDFTTGPLEYALLVKALGYQKTMSWFPVLPKDKQAPYDVGPYLKESPSPIESQLSIQVASANSITNSPAQQVSSAESKAVSSLVKTISELPSTAIHHGSNSNNWAVDGTKTASKQAMLAGDPHLDQTLPAIWYQVSASSPSHQFQGATIPGLPVILIGKNQNIAWSLTNVQNQATLFYQEKMNPKHPNEYFWMGKWRKVQRVTYDIPIKGAQTISFPVKLTVHGPIMTQDGQTLSVDWIGALPSPNIDSMLSIIRSSDFEQFKQALQSWHAPAQNFIYADTKGNIGLISAGYYPIVKSGSPWLPLPGNGQSDIIGTIPYNQIPQAYDPPSHILFSANQREVSNSYPYYIGTTMNFFDNGYRADEIQSFLSSHSQITNADFEQLQNNTTDVLAGEIVPKLVHSLSSRPLTSTEKQAQTLLKGWNDEMVTKSAAATIWWTFWNTYLNDTFGPWWSVDKVPTSLDTNLLLGSSQTSLVEDLEYWTLSDPNNAAFNLPSGKERNANLVMSEAFSQAISKLAKQLGDRPSTWFWGKVHTREFPSLAQISSLGYGPRSSSGDSWTVDAADGGMTSTAGPSWRMIVNFGGKNEGVYPGGQSENPASPWYENEISSWWNGEYYPISASPNANGGSIATWSLAP